MTTNAMLMVATVSIVPLVVRRAWRAPRPKSRVDVPDTGAPLRTSSPGLVQRLGRRVLAACGRPADEGHDRAIGRLIVAVSLCFIVDLALAAVAFVAFVSWPLLSRRRRSRTRGQQVLRELPEIVDLYSVALYSGHNVATASREVVRAGDGLFAASLAEAIERVDRGQPLDLALEDLAAELGAHVRPVTSVLVSGLRYGAPISESLERVATDLRLERRRQAERAARRLPVAMLFPLVVCVLPAFGLLTVVPVLFESLRSLSLP